MQRPLVVNLGTIYDSQDLPQQILPDRQPEDWEVGLAAEQSPLEAQVAALEAQVAETSLDSADEVLALLLKRHLRFLETSGILMFG